MNAKAEVYISAIWALLLLIVTAAFHAISVASSLMVIALALSMYGLCRTVQMPETNPVQLTAFAYITFYFLLPGLSYLWIDRFPWYHMRYRDQSIEQAVMVCLVFLIFLFVGLRVGLRRRSFRGRGIEPRNLPLAFKRSDAGPPSSRILVACLIVLIIAIASGLTVGYDPFTRRGDGGIDIKATPVTLILKSLSGTGSYIALILSIVYARKQGAVAVLLPILVSIPFLAANSPIATPRFILGAHILTAAFFFWAPGPRGKIILLFCLIAAQFTVFPLVSEISRGGGAAAFKFSPFEYMSTHGDFDGFQSTINVVVMCYERGFQYGLQLLSALLFFVPRPWFPAKSAGLGGDAASHVGYSFVNISSPLPSELFADFGFLGLPVLAGAAGYVIARFDSRFDSALRTGNWVNLLIPAFIAGYAFILLRGSLVGVLGPFASSVLLTLLAQHLLRFRPSGPSLRLASRMHLREN